MCIFGLSFKALTVYNCFWLYFLCAQGLKPSQRQGIRGFLGIPRRVQSLINVSILLDSPGLCERFSKFPVDSSLPRTFFYVFGQPPVFHNGYFYLGQLQC